MAFGRLAGGAVVNSIFGDEQTLADSKKRDDPTGFDALLPTLTWMCMLNQASLRTAA